MIEPILRKNLYSLASAFAKATHCQITTISRRYHGHHEFLNRYNAGEVSVTGAKYDQIVESLRRDWPAGTPFPKLAPIPVPKKPAHN